MNGKLAPIVSYCWLAPEIAPPVLGFAEPFRAMLVAEALVTPDWRATVAKWLVESGCLYLVAWGDECSLWHDEVDEANLDSFDWEPIPDDRFVMTTWHAREPLEDAMWFSQNCAEHPNVPLSRTLILHIAESPDMHRLLAQYAASADVAE